MRKSLSSQYEECSFSLVAFRFEKNKQELEGTESQEIKLP